MADSKKILVQNQRENYYGFIVLTAGIKLERFKKNPVMLYMHDMLKLIGKWINLTVEGDTILAEPKFNSKNAFAAEREQEYTDGFLNATSLGLKPIKWESGDKYGFPADTLVLSECELKEISMATIGANEDTVRLYGDDDVLFTDEQMKQVKLSAQSSISQQPIKNKMDFKTILIATLGLKADATDAEITTALQNMKNQNVNLTADKEKWENAEKLRATEAITNELNLAVKDKRITEEQKPTWETLLKVDFKAGKAGLDAIVPAGAAPVNLSAEVNKSKADGGEVVELKTITDYYKNGKADELQKMKTDKKADYIKLCAASGIAEADIEW